MLELFVISATINVLLIVLLLGVLKQRDDWFYIAEKRKERNLELLTVEIESQCLKAELQSFIDSLQREKDQKEKGNTNGIC